MTAHNEKSIICNEPPVDALHSGKTLTPPLPVGISERDFENGNIAENWKRWRQTMRLMLQGTLSKKDEKQQCGYFLLYLGQNGRDIYNTWTLTSAETDKIDVLFEKYEAYCIPKQNVTVIRYKFNTRN